MGIWFISILLSVSPQFGLMASAVLFQPVLLASRALFKVDSPRPGPVSRMHVTESVSGKLLIKKIEPEYPADAQAAGVEGDVVFSIVIGKNGRVEEIHLRRGKPVFLEAAARAVSQRRYKPYVFNGGPVEVETFATVRFRLSEKHWVAGGVPTPVILNALAHSLPWSRQVLIRSAPDPSQAQDDVKVVDIRVSHAQSVELSPRPVRRTPSANAGVNGMLTAIWEYLACCARSSWWTCFRG